MNKRLQEIRKSLRLTQEEISTQLGISYRAYSSYERGDRKPTFEMLQELVIKYNVNLNWLVANQGNMFVAPPFEQVQSEIALEVRKILKEEGLIK